MKTTMEWIVSLWQLYWHGGYYQYLLLASAAYLLIFHRKKRSVRQVLAFSACLLLVFFCPLTAKVIAFCIGTSVYWRVIWLLPTIPVIALAATEFLRGRKSRLLQACLLIVCCGVIALSGRDMLSEGNFVRTENRQKVPDDVAHVCNMIRAEAEKDGITDIYVMSDNYLASYIRVYDPSIRQAFSRWGLGSANYTIFRAYRRINSSEPRNYRKIAKAAWKSNCNFLVIEVPDRKVKKIERFGYVEIGDVGSYSIFQLEEA